MTNNGEAKRPNTVIHIPEQTVHDAAEAAADAFLVAVALLVYPNQDTTLFRSNKCWEVLGDVITRTVTEGPKPR
jgi:hypothetical protein